MLEIESGHSDILAQPRDRTVPRREHVTVRRDSQPRYEELHRRAHLYMRHETPGHTLQTTALVNEAYLRLVDLRQVSWRDRAHFFALASRVIRHVLVDAARSRRSLKRGADMSPAAIDEELLVSVTPPADILALDDALHALAAVDDRKNLPGLHSVR